MARQPGSDGTAAPTAPAGGAPIAVRRVALIVEYDGGAFAGMQRQKRERTVAGALEDAARRLGSTEPALLCAGRTDAGVHAAGQVIALSVPERIPADRLQWALNAVLPPDVRVRRSIPCAADFDPRRDAIARVYRYRMCVGVPVPPLARHMVAYVPRLRCEELLADAAAAYLGRWEFKEWRSSRCEAKWTELAITRAETLPPDATRPHYEFVFAARSFLHHMVRFLVGGAIAVGNGRLTLEELRAALASGTRPASVAPADACGLSLERVVYPPDRDPFRVE